MPMTISGPQYGPQFGLIPAAPRTSFQGHPFEARCSVSNSHQVDHPNSHPIKRSLLGIMTGLGLLTAGALTINKANVSRRLSEGLIAGGVVSTFFGFLHTLRTVTAFRREKKESIQHAGMPSVGISPQSPDVLFPSQLFDLPAPVLQGKYGYQQTQMTITTTDDDGIEQGWQRNALSVQMPQGAAQQLRKGNDIADIKETGRPEYWTWTQESTWPGFSDAPKAGKQTVDLISPKQTQPFIDAMEAQVAALQLASNSFASLLNPVSPAPRHETHHP